MLIPKRLRIRPVAAVVTCFCAIISGLPWVGQGASAETPVSPAVENDYYTITPLPIPPSVYLEVGALELMDGKLYASSRRGDIYSVANPLGEPSAMEFTRFAGGLHEVLGVSARDGSLYVTQRCEVSKLTDIDGDGMADTFDTISDFWGINGDYHEYAFGSKFDADGNIWVALCLTGSFTADSPYRGWCIRVSPDGKSVPTCSGLRSPGGLGMNDQGDMFYTDNQGPWNGTCGLKHLRIGSFQGNPMGNKFYDKSGMGEQPEDPESKSRIMVEAKKIPELEPTAVLFPYKKMGQSASGIVTDRTGGKFGPFAGQMFVGDQTQSTVMRVFLEKVNGHYQGVCFPFHEGFGSGTLALCMDKSGAMFVGGTNRGWGSRGNKPYALERLNWTGKTPFEVHQMRIQPDGFELTFTQPVDARSVESLESYALQTYTYIYQSDYGSPEVDHAKPPIVKATLGTDGKSVRLVIDGLKEGHVHELKMPGIRSAGGQPLLHQVAYYTANYIPEK